MRLLASRVPQAAPYAGAEPKALTRLELRQVDEAFADLELGLRLSQGVADEPPPEMHLLPSLVMKVIGERFMAFIELWMELVQSSGHSWLF